MQPSNRDRFLDASGKYDPDTGLWSEPELKLKSEPDQPTTNPQAADLFGVEIPEEITITGDEES